MANVVESDPTRIADEFNRYFTNIAQKIRENSLAPEKAFVTIWEDQTRTLSFSHQLAPKRL